MGVFCLFQLCKNAGASREKCLTTFHFSEESWSITQYPQSPITGKDIFWWEMLWHNNSKIHDPTGSLVSQPHTAPVIYFSQFRVNCEITNTMKALEKENFIRAMITFHREQSAPLPPIPILELGGTIRANRRNTGKQILFFLILCDQKCLSGNMKALKDEYHLLFACIPI